MFKINLVKKTFAISLLIIGFIINIASVQAKIVASIKPIGFITKAIATDVTDVEILLPDGASPHSYSLKPSDLIKLKSADLIVWIGDDMETFLPSLLRNISPEKQIELADNAQIQALLRNGHSHEDEEDEHDHDHESHDHDHHHGQYDMHIWLSPEIAAITAQIIHDQLKVVYPEKSALLDDNLNQFIAQLNDTKQIIAKKFDNLQNKGYFVFHDAYGYFESEFKLNNLGSFTINPSIQPGVKKIYEVQNELKSKNAVCIFREPQFSPTIIEKLVNGTNVKVGELDPLGIDIALSKDSYSQFLLNMAEQLSNCLE